LARQKVGVAVVVDADLLQHLPDDQLDVLVVDLDALRLVDLLHLTDEVQLRRSRSLEREQLGRVERALVQGIAGLDRVALPDEQPGAARERVLLRVDRLAVGVIACRDSLPDAWELVDGIREALRELVKASAATIPVSSDPREVTP